jgi:hypothetical protein
MLPLCHSTEIGKELADKEMAEPERTGMLGSADPRDGPENRRHIARLVLVVFLITFTATRILVFLIMSQTLPDLFIYIGGTHVHHLNLGIFLLSGVGGYSLFARPKGRRAEGAAVLYGIGLALTFDEFGMWLHLGGGYWQRASFDAVTVVAGLLMLMAFAPSVKEFRGKQAITALILLLLGAAFFLLLLRTINDFGGKAEPRQDKIGRIQSRSEAGSGTVARSTSLLVPRPQAAL